MSGFTPGPWVTFDSNNAGTGISTEAGASFATAWSSGGVPLLEFPHAANARLIAAAPDLYKALDETLGEMKALMAKWPPYTGGQNIADRADAALRKARGEARDDGERMRYAK
jgi:hypothetical protein